MKTSTTSKTSGIDSQLLSHKLGELLASKNKLYIADLENVFLEKSFAIALLLIIALILGLLGVVAEVFFGSLLIRFFQNFFN